MRGRQGPSFHCQGTNCGRDLGKQEKGVWKIRERPEKKANLMESSSTGDAYIPYIQNLRGSQRLQQGVHFILVMRVYDDEDGKK